MAADEKQTDHEPRTSRPSDPGADLANPAGDRSTYIGLGRDQDDDRSTFIGLGTGHDSLSPPPSEAQKSAPSSVSSGVADDKVSSGAADDKVSSGAADSNVRSAAADDNISSEAPLKNDEEPSKAPPPAASPESSTVGRADATSPSEPASKREPAALVGTETASDRAEAPKETPIAPKAEKPAPTNGAAKKIEAATPSAVAAQARRSKDTNGGQRRATGAARASRTSEVAERGSRTVDKTPAAQAAETPRKTSRGTVLFALAAIAIVGGWWMVTRETTSNETSNSPAIQQEPAPTKVESTALTAQPTAAEPTTQEQTQPSPGSQPSDNRAAPVSAKLAAEGSSNAPVANAPEDNTTGKAASSLLMIRKAAIVAIAKNKEIRHCRRKPDPVGTAQVLATFDSSGRVSNARVRSPYNATHTGVCLVEGLKQVTIDPFSGDSFTIETAIELY